MDEYIECEAAIDCLMGILDKPHHAEFLYTDEICGTLNSIPAADAIEELSKDLERSKEYEALWEDLANEALKKFQLAIASKPRWISVEKDGLPLEPGEYLVYVRCGITAEIGISEFDDMDLSYVTTAYFDMDNCIWKENDKYYNGNLNCVKKNKTYYISHWMDKPEPPKNSLEKVEANQKKSLEKVEANQKKSLEKVE